MKKISSSDANNNLATNGNHLDPVCDDRLASFILWISNPLKEEVFVEISITLLFLRIVIYFCIWYDHNKDNVQLQNESLNLKFKDKTYTINLSKSEVLNIKSFTDNNICPILGTKWAEIKRTTEGNLVKMIVDDVNASVAKQEIDKTFYDKVKIFSDMNNGALNKLEIGRASCRERV